MSIYFLYFSGYSVHSGHYYAYFKGRNNLWYCGNDSSVYQSKLPTALNQNAYVLFYMIDKPDLLDNIVKFEKNVKDITENIPKPIENKQTPVKKENIIKKEESDNDEDPNVMNLSKIAKEYAEKNDVKILHCIIIYF